MSPSRFCIHGHGGINGCSGSRGSFRLVASAEVHLQGRPLETGCITLVDTFTTQRHKGVGCLKELFETCAAQWVPVQQDP